MAGQHYENCSEQYRLHTLLHAQFRHGEYVQQREKRKREKEKGEV